MVYSYTLLICASVCPAFKGSTVNSVILEFQLCTTNRHAKGFKNVSIPELTLVQLLKILRLKDLIFKAAQVPT